MVLVSQMLRQLPAIARSLCFLGCGALLCCPSLYAQENCQVEVKLLLAPEETRTAVAALGGKKGMTGRIYFFDTGALELLSQGVIVRLRQGSKSDLTVKLRLPAGKKFSGQPGRLDGFKCEADQTQEGAKSSYSITKRLVIKEIPQAGTDVFRLLSSAQIKLLEDAHVSVDWTGVKRIAEITSTDWRTQSQPHLGRLTMELWEWPGGKVLEISTRVSTDAGSSTYAALQQLVETKQLVMSRDQRVKTTIALEAITRGAAH